MNDAMRVIFSGTSAWSREDEDAVMDTIRVQRDVIQVGHTWLLNGKFKIERRADDGIAAQFYVSNVSVGIDDAEDTRELSA
jgi:hypothetical protein